MHIQKTSYSLSMTFEISFTRILIINIMGRNASDFYLAEKYVPSHKITNFDKDLDKVREVTEARRAAMQSLECFMTQSRVVELTLELVRHLHHKTP